MNDTAQKSGLRGSLKQQESLARYTSWRVGGIAEKFYQPADREDFIEFLSTLPEDEPLFVMGMGSNILVRDGGMKGTVINLRNCLNRLELAQDDQQGALIYAEAGVNSSQLARFAVKQGLCGSEFLVGIPGSIGGALAMNAGCYGSETWQYVERVEMVNAKGQSTLRQPEEFDVSYRTVKFPAREWFVAGWFRFTRNQGKADRERVRELLNQRSETQPIGSYSCGSVFRNPAGNYAAKLIEACGLKGYRIGGARVSDKHANFILNDANATATDIEQLIEYVQAKVEENTGVLLQREVKIVGESV
ncbi:MAG: UDP-N-acetylmuramate dehydrogenase [Gammaproteobacteria bacterium]|nr:UDP-N-acetylmuramate dehydrogenase [Gammaproteobacteria bacterium]